MASKHSRKPALREAFNCTQCGKTVGKNVKRATFRGQRYCWPCVYPFAKPSEVAFVSGKHRGTEVPSGTVKVQNAPSKGGESGGGVQAS